MDVDCNLRREDPVKVAEAATPICPNRHTRHPLGLLFCLSTSLSLAPHSPPHPLFSFPQINHFCGAIVHAHFHKPTLPHTTTTRRSIFFQCSLSRLSVTGGLPPILSSLASQQRTTTTIHHIHCDLHNPPIFARQNGEMTP